MPYFIIILYPCTLLSADIVEDILGDKDTILGTLDNVVDTDGDIVVDTVEDILREVLAE